MFVDRGIIWPNWNGVDLTFIQLGQTNVYLVSGYMPKENSVGNTGIFCLAFYPCIPLIRLTIVYKSSTTTVLSFVIFLLMYKTKHRGRVSDDIVTRSFFVLQVSDTHVWLSSQSNSQYILQHHAKPQISRHLCKYKINSSSLHLAIYKTNCQYWLMKLRWIQKIC